MTLPVKHGDFPIKTKKLGIDKMNHNIIPPKALIPYQARGDRTEVGKSMLDETDL